jgi:hypothetical protein
MNESRSRPCPHLAGEGSTQAAKEEIKLTESAFIALFKAFFAEIKAKFA